jgi:hypothetical protein
MLFPLPFQLGFWLYSVRVLCLLCFVTWPLRFCWCLNSDLMMVYCNSFEVGLLMSHEFRAIIANDLLFLMYVLIWANCVHFCGSLLADNDA